jgi:SAM-dependent methyltransferase
MSGTATWKTAYEPGELREVACPICGATESRTVASEFGIEIARCSSCGMVFTRTPLPAPQSHYGVSADGALEKYGAVFRGEEPHPRDANYDEHLDTLEHLTTGRRLLDVGTHCGFFLRRAKARGWDTHGVEPSPTSAGLAREYFGLDVQAGTIQDADVADAGFDAVTLTDVLEHIEQPRAVLSAAHRALRPGGVLFKHRTLGRLPGLLDDVFDAREHVAFYSSEALTDVLTASGFADVRVLIPAPIQAGGIARRVPRAAGAWLARRLPHGDRTALPTDLVGIGRKAG